MFFEEGKVCFRACLRMVWRKMREFVCFFCEKYSQIYIVSGCWKWRFSSVQLPCTLLEGGYTLRVVVLGKKIRFY